MITQIPSTFRIKVLPEQSEDTQSGNLIYTLLHFVELFFQTC